MAPLSTHPPDFTPTQHFTAKQHESLKIGADSFLWPEEVVVLLSQVHLHLE